MSARLAAAAVALALAASVAGARSRRAPCDPGSFAVHGAALVDASRPADTDVVLFRGAQVLVESGCESARVRVHAGRTTTRLRARLRGCGPLGLPARLDARIDAETCSVMTGSLRMRRSGTTRSFRAFRQGLVVGGASTFEVIQSRIFAARGCTVVACHGASATAGLDLRPGAAHLALVDVPAENPAARAAGTKRVEPGSPGASFLLRKLAGTLGFGEGAAMPLLGRRLLPIELDVVRAWIAAGAPATGTVIGAVALPPLAYEPAPPLPPPPAGGFQLVLEGPTLAPGEEQEGCLWVPPPTATDVSIRSFEVALNPGTHHFAVWVRDAPDVPETGVWDAGDIACLSGARFGASIGGSGQAPYSEASLPEGIAGVLPGGRYLGLNAHYYNEFDVPIEVRAWINFYPYEGTPRHVAQGITALDTTFGIDVPPGTRQVRRGRFVNTLARPMAIFGLSGHMHKRGVRFTAWDAAQTKLFETFDWAHPGGRSFDPPLVLAPGGHLDYECLHDNGVTRPVRRDAAGNPATLVFGISAEDEMCILTGSYYTD